MSPRCCPGHVDPADGTCENRAVGWCLNSLFDGCEPCCENCPDFDWCGLNGCVTDPETNEIEQHFCQWKWK